MSQPSENSDSHGWNRKSWLLIVSGSVIALLAIAGAAALQRPRSIAISTVQRIRRIPFARLTVRLGTQPARVEVFERSLEL